jgi:hypothetical protein
MFNGAIEDDFVLTSSLFASRKFPVLVKEFPVPSAIGNFALSH